MPTAKLRSSTSTAWTYRPLMARHQGCMDALADGGSGIEVVADETTPKETTQEGFEKTNTILQAHPNATVWLGADSTLVGALSALESADKVTEMTYLSGVNGDKEALNKVLEGGPYKSSFAFTYALLGYAWGAATQPTGWMGRQFRRCSIFSRSSWTRRRPSRSSTKHRMSLNLADALASGKYLGLKGTTSYETFDNYLKKDF